MIFLNGWGRIGVGFGERLYGDSIGEIEFSLASGAVAFALE